jgi:hypothetical protein
MLKYSILFGTIFSIPQTPQQSNSSVQTSPPPPTGNIPSNSSLSSALEASSDSAKSSDAAVVGNCLTQRIDFSGNVIWRVLVVPLKKIAGILSIEIELHYKHSLTFYLF